MLELAILGLLKERPMHGYDLRKCIRDDFGPLSNLSFGSLYPALARLEAAGAIRVVDVRRSELGPADGASPAASPAFLPLTGSLGGERAAQMARRATAKAAAALGSHGNRGRKIFEITERGELLFAELLDDPTGRDDPRGFSLRLSFARHLSPAARARLLERRRLYLADRVDLARRTLSAPGRVLDSYERAIVEHSLEIALSDLRWIEGLLARELSQASALTTAAEGAGPVGLSQPSDTVDPETALDLQEHVVARTASGVRISAAHSALG